MAAAHPLPPSIDDFLVWEQRQEQRYELLDGLVVAMVGGTADHNTIVLNIAAALRAALRGGPCRVFAESMKVVTAQAVMYPDVLVTCSPVEPKADAVLTPCVVVEVLSRSTHEIDRGRKWLAYQQLETLQQYVLVSQDEARVEQYRRTNEGWSYRVLAGLEHEVSLPAGDPPVRLSLGEIYESTSVLAPRSTGA
ncbi:MAG: Uma2 family endonuclease [Myxococcales bacterium]|nr:Uma2 family endonuclease [Myxococcales bacterium]